MYKRLVQNTLNQVKYERPENIAFTYDDITRYRGPTVEGWPPGADRNLVRLVKPKEDNFIIKPSGKLLT